MVVQDPFGVAMLTPFLRQIVKAAWRARDAMFWPVWITITVAVAIFHKLRVILELAESVVNLNQTRFAG